jgi:hypothetical protein
MYFLYIGKSVLMMWLQKLKLVASSKGMRGVSGQEASLRDLKKLFLDGL